MKTIEKSGKEEIYDDTVNGQTGQILISKTEAEYEAPMDLARYAVIYQDDSLDYEVCLESVRTQGYETNDGSAYSYILKFNLDKPCTNPFAQTEKVLKRFLKNESLEHFFKSLKKGPRHTNVGV